MRKECLSALGSQVPLPVGQPHPQWLGDSAASAEVSAAQKGADDSRTTNMLVSERIRQFCTGHDIRGEALLHVNGTGGEIWYVLAVIRTLLGSMVHLCWGG